MCAFGNILTCYLFEILKYVEISTFKLVNESITTSLFFLNCDFPQLLFNIFPTPSISTLLATPLTLIFFDTPST